MFKLVLGALALSLCASARGAYRDGNADPLRKDSLVSLEMTLVDPHGLLPAGRRQVAREVSRLFERLGVPIQWNRDPLREPENGSIFPVRAVFLPSEPSGPGWSLPASALGVTVGDGTRPAHAVYVFYPRVLRALGLSTSETRLPSNVELKSLTRALGRVIAHEVFHAVAPGEEHAGGGLMGAGLSPELLVGEDVLVDARWRGLLKARLEAFAEP